MRLKYRTACAASCLRRLTIAITASMLPLVLTAQNWDAITSSADYYFGVGNGSTEEEAAKAALSFLLESIAVNVQSDFTSVEVENQTVSGTEHLANVRRCLRTYSQTSLTDVLKMSRRVPSGYEVLRFVPKTEVMKLYDARIRRARNMVEDANIYLKNNQLDFALQYYYWADALIRSVQRPSEVTGADGRVLTDWIHRNIREILRKIRVEFLGRSSDDEVRLRFTYEGVPVQSLGFTYNDGHSLDNDGMVIDGEGILRMAPGSPEDYYHIKVDCEYRSQAYGDQDVEPVLAVLSARNFPEATIDVQAIQPAQRPEPKPQPKPLSPVTASLPPAVVSTCNSALGRVLDAIRVHRYADAEDCFTFEGRHIYHTLLRYGAARLAAPPQNVQLVPGANGTVVARGIPMTFEFRQGRGGTGRKRTFREEITFVFNPDGKICSLAFGIGHQAEQGILGQDEWNPQAREIVLEFMENYKTAYHLKRINYISDIFANDARIITGYVVRPSKISGYDDLSVSTSGLAKIAYSEHTKASYIEKLKDCFARNEFINLRFSKNEAQWLDKLMEEKNKEVYAIQIGQEYTSSNYADRGYLFLLVDLTDHQAPLIRIRTWQPNEEDMRKLYSAGDFFND